MVVVDLSAQPLDVHLDQVRHRVEAVVPDVLGDVGAADDVALAPRQVLEQRVFLRRELNGTPATLDAARPRVDGEILDLEHRGCERRPSAEQGANPREQLGKVVRLGQIVVGADVEAFDALIRLPASRQHEDRRRDALGAQPAAHLQAVDAGHQDVEDDEVVVADARLLEGRRSVGGDVNGIRVLAQSLRRARLRRRVRLRRPEFSSDSSPAASEGNACCSSGCLSADRGCESRRICANVPGCDFPPPSPVRYTVPSAAIATPSPCASPTAFRSTRPASVQLPANRSAAR